MIDPMDAATNAIEPQFLSEALARDAQLRIGKLNKTELEGVLREIGRYEINVESHGSIVTILKQDISFLSTSTSLITPAATEAGGDTAGAAPPPAKPNIQQEFLDKAIREHHLLTIFLLSGQRIRATVEAYDNFTLLLREGDRQYLYYKHAITTINR